MKGREESKDWNFLVNHIVYLPLLLFVFRNLDESHNDNASKLNQTSLSNEWRQQDDKEECFIIRHEE